MKTIAIPLGRLQLAETNMRTSHRSAGLEELKASLLVHGQLQPIVVTRASDGAGFAVVAGARRTLAARALVAEGKWPDTARLAAVRRRAGEAEARELSLAENLQRVAPCAADEALAFARLVGDGADPAAPIRRRWPRASAGRCATSASGWRWPPSAPPSWRPCARAAWRWPSPRR